MVWWMGIIVIVRVRVRVRFVVTVTVRVDLSVVDLPARLSLFGLGLR